VVGPLVGRLSARLQILGCTKKNVLAQGSNPGLYEKKRPLIGNCLQTYTCCPRQPAFGAFFRRVEFSLSYRSQMFCLTLSNKLIYSFYINEAHFIDLILFYCCRIAGTMVILSELFEAIYQRIAIQERSTPTMDFTRSLYFSNLGLFNLQSHGD